MSESRPQSNSGANAQHAAHVDSGWLLVRWIAIPIVLVAAIYFVQRTYDERPFVVVTDHGAMPSPDQIAARPGETPATPPPTTSLPPAPALPAPSDAARPAPSEPSTALRPISRPSPPYPARALEAEREGVVRLRLTITPDGHVSDAVAIHAEPPGWFERAAESGARRWQYEPPGRAVTTETEVEFKLN